MPSLIDMGAIIPIVMALLLFFGTLVYTINTIEEKNKKMELLFALFEVSNMLTEKGVVTDEWIEKVKETLENDDYEFCIEKRGENTCEARSPTYISLEFPVSFQTNKDGIPFNEIRVLKVVVWPKV